MKRVLFFIVIMLFLFTLVSADENTKEITIAYNGQPENPDFQLAQNYLKEITKITGIEFQLTTLNNYRSVTSLIMGNVDANFMRLPDNYENTDTALTTTVPLFSQKYYAFTKISDKPLPQGDDWKEIPVVTVAGAMYLDKWKTENFIYRNHSYEDNYSALEALVYGMGDYFFGPGYLVPLLEEINKGLENPVIAIPLDIPATPVYLILNSEKHYLVNELDRALLQLTITGKTAELFNITETTVASQ